MTKLSAQFEHAVAVTGTGVEIVTLRRDEAQLPAAGSRRMMSPTCREARHSRVKG